MSTQQSSQQTDEQNETIEFTVSEEDAARLLRLLKLAKRANNATDAIYFSDGECHTLSALYGTLDGQARSQGLEAEI